MNSQIKVITSSELSNTEIEDGFFIYTTDDNKLYLDKDGNRESLIENAVIYYGTIGTSWADDENAGTKTQTINIEGISTEHTGVLDIIYKDGENYASFVEAQNQFLSYITNGYAETFNGGIIFTIFGDANTVEIPFILEVV